MVYRLYAYYRIVSDHGIRALYGGLRTRLMFNMMPVSPFVFWGINDSLVYRRILGQVRLYFMIIVCEVITYPKHRDLSILLVDYCQWREKLPTKNMEVP